MKDSKSLSNGERNFAWWINYFIAAATIYIGLYLFPALLVTCAVIVGVCYLYIWWSWGFIGIPVFLFCIALLSYISMKLVEHPEYKIFQQKPWTYKSILITDKVMAKVRRFFGIAHTQYWLGSKWLYTRYRPYVEEKLQAMWKLPLGKKAIIALVAFALIIPISYFVSDSTVRTVNSKWPYGKNRGSMSDEQLAVRRENRINHALFAVWGKEGAVSNAEKTLQYENLISEEAIKNGLTPLRLLGQLFVESNGNVLIVNTDSGTAGIAQIKITVACEEGLIDDKEFCDKVKKLGDAIKTVPENLKSKDGRLVPERAIPVAARIIGKAKKYWGDENWAFVQYHMGQGNMRVLFVHYMDETHPGWDKEFPIDRTLVKVGKKKNGSPIMVMRIQLSDPNGSIPKAIAKYAVSYDDIFFRTTPTTTPKAYAYLHKLSDFSASYVYTGLAAQKGFELMKSDKKAFQKMVADQQDPDGGIANRRMRAYWKDGDAKYNVLSDIAKDIKTGNNPNGKLVPVPNDASNGFILRTSGGDRIGECDAGQESGYYFTRKATMGLIYFMAARAKEMGMNPFEVTGLVRTNVMYSSGCLPGTNPKTHVMGVAFDIGAMVNGKLMSAKDRQILNFIIQDLWIDGLIDRIPEGIADHIVYNPEFEKFFEDVYDEVQAGSSPLVVSGSPEN